MLLVPEAQSVELTLEPKLPQDPVTSLRRQPGARQGEWLVDGIYELGTHGGVAGRRAGRAGYAAEAGEQGRHGLTGRLGLVWMLVPLELLSLIVIVPAGSSPATGWPTGG